MPDPVTGLVVGGTALIGGVLGSRAQRKAAESAGAAQVQAAELGIEETRRQFDAVQELMKPYVEAGGGALESQQALLGLLGEERQAGAISGIDESPLFQALAGQGEEALLQRASATGGLRGGNIQGALAQFRPQLLSQQIQQQFQNLSGITNVGQASAVGQAAAGQQTGVNISNLLEQQGAAQAGASLAKGKAKAELFNLPSQLLATYVGGGGKF